MPAATSLANSSASVPVSTRRNAFSKRLRSPLSRVATPSSSSPNSRSRSAASASRTAE